MEFRLQGFVVLRLRIESQKFRVLSLLTTAREVASRIILRFSCWLKVRDIG